jgi:hypothetical protein
VQLKALFQLLGSIQARNVVIVVQATGAAERDIARGTMVVTTLQAEAITAVVLGSAWFLGRVLTDVFQVGNSLSVGWQLLEFGTLASAGLFQSLASLEGWSSGCLRSSAAEVGAMDNQIIAVLRIVSLVVTDNSLVTTKRWSQVKLIVFESSGSGRDIVVVSVFACLTRWSNRDGGGYIATDRRHAWWVKSIHLVVGARGNAQEVAEKRAVMNSGLI